jgi:hypothetical protein
MSERLTKGISSTTGGGRVFDAGFSTRTKNALIQSDIEFCQDAFDMTDWELLRLPGFGRTALKELRAHQSVTPPDRRIPNLLCDPTRLRRAVKLTSADKASVSGKLDYPTGSFAKRLQKAGAKSCYDDPLTIEKLLSTLQRREEHVVRLRHGLGPFAPATLTEIGQVIGLSRSRVSQIEQRAFRQLKWLTHTYDVNDHADFDDILERLALAADNRRRAEEAAAAEKRQQEELARQIKDAEDERRRAAARHRAWRTKLKQAERDEMAARTELAAIEASIAKVEKRGWLLRTILPHESRLTELQRMADDLSRQLAAKTDAAEKIRNSPPEPNTEGFR